MQHCLNTFGWRILASATLLGACTVTTTDPEGEGGAAGASGSGGSAGETSSAGASGSGGGGAGTAGSGGTGGGTATVFECGSRAAATATVVEPDIVEDTTWSGTVRLEGDVTVTEGATLTIAPGTQIIAAADSQLEIGWNGSAATLVAEGTAAAPILFCGATADAGFWQGLIVRNNVTSNSTLHNVLIADAGGVEQALLIQSELSVQGVQIENSGADGVRAAQFADDSADLSVRGADGFAVALTDARAVSPFPLGGAFSDNGLNVIQLELDDIPVSAAFHDLGIPYVQESAVTVTEGATAHFDAGVEYQFAADAYLEVGWNSSDAILEIAGTAEAPVVFRGVDETPGYWGGLLVRNNVRTSSTIANLTLRHGGGSGEPALRIDSAIRLNDVKLELNETGAQIGAQGLDEASANLSITTTEAVPLTVVPNALISLPEGGVFTGNQTDHIAIEAGDYSVTGTVPNLGIPYRVLGPIDTIESSMTIAAGTHFIMSADSDIEFGWNGNSATIIAEGTAAAPIRFTGLDPVAGYWGGLIIGTNVVSASKLDYVEVSHGADYCLRVQNPIPVTNSTFSTCTGAGILKDADDTALYTDTNTFTAVGTNVGTP
jgi:hypothetical protein